MLALMGSNFTIFLVIVLAATSACSAAHANDSVAIDSFEFLGCSGDWADENASPEIWRMSSSIGTTYLVRHPATCGANAGREAEASFNAGTLDLNYEPYNTDGIYAMCMCEFWAKFTLRSEPQGVKSATFGTSVSRLKGAWPER